VNSYFGVCLFVGLMPGRSGQSGSWSMSQRKRRAAWLPLPAAAAAAAAATMTGSLGPSVLCCAAASSTGAALVPTAAAAAAVCTMSVEALVRGDAVLEAAAIANRVLTHQPPGMRWCSAMPTTSSGTTQCEWQQRAVCHLLLQSCLVKLELRLLRFSHFAGCHGVGYACPAVGAGIPGANGTKLLI